MCGRLLKAMYCTRDAAQNWEFEYCSTMGGVSFQVGKAPLCMLYHAEKDIRVVVHGDDFTVLGTPQNLDWFRDRISSRFEVKFRGRLGGDKGDVPHIRILNRIVSWFPDRIEWEADQRHAEIIIKQMGLLKDSHAVKT